MNPGYITISRKFFDCDLWREKRPRTKAEAWLDLLQSAAFAPHPVQTSRGVVALDRGELLASFRYLADRWQWSVKQVRGFLENLLRSERIQVQREAQAGTVYLVVNYALYQGEGTDSDTPNGTGKGTARAQQGHKDKKGNKGKKESQNGPAGADDPGFCAVYDALPKRTGGHDRKAAFTNYRASIAAGVEPQAMLDGAHRYRAFCDAIGRSGTTYVYDAKNFCRLDRELWTDAWDVPLQVSRGNSREPEPQYDDPNAPGYVGIMPDGKMSPTMLRLSQPRAS